jgi:hypothetical protein
MLVHAMRRAERSKFLWLGLRLQAHRKQLPLASYLRETHPRGASSQPRIVPSSFLRACASLPWRQQLRPAFWQIAPFTEHARVWKVAPRDHKKRQRTRVAQESISARLGPHAATAKATDWRASVVLRRQELRPPPRPPTTHKHTTTKSHSQARDR